GTDRSPPGAQGRAAASETGPVSAVAVLDVQEVRLRAATAEPAPFGLAAARSGSPWLGAPAPNERRSLPGGGTAVRVLEGHDGGGRAKYATASSLESTDREHRSASLRGGVFAFAGVSLSLTGSSASRAGSSAPRIGEFLALA